MSAMALLLTLALIPLLFGPDSPRFKLVILRKITLFAIDDINSAYDAANMCVIKQFHFYIKISLSLNLKFNGSSFIKEERRRQEKSLSCCLVLMMSVSSLKNIEQLSPFMSSAWTRSPD